jgi:hypothetical protein
MKTKYQLIAKMPRGKVLHPVSYYFFTFPGLIISLSQFHGFLMMYFEILL